MICSTRQMKMLHIQIMGRLNDILLGWMNSWALCLVLNASMVEGRRCVRAIHSCSTDLGSHRALRMLKHSTNYQDKAVTCLSSL